MEETNNQAEKSSNKKKKKFVYLEKYEVYKEQTDGKIKQLEKAVNFSYLLMALVWIVLLMIIF